MQTLQQTLQRLLLLSMAVAMITACARNKPIVDTQGVNMARYHQDLAACQQYAEQVNTGEKVAAGATGGAVVGGAIGAIFNGTKGAQRGAGAGAVGGAAKGAAAGNREQQQVVKNCLRGRGYRVLN